MLRRARRFLRSIDYHSARRTRTVWTRLSDAALFAGPLLALAIAVVLHSAMPRDASPPPAEGMIGRSPPGEWAAWSLDEWVDVERYMMVGTFTVQLPLEVRGWPLESGRRAWPAAVTSQRTFPEPGGEMLGDPAIRAVVEEAIKRTLRPEHRPDLDPTIFAAMSERREVSRFHLRPFLGNVLLWWFLLALLLPLGVQLLRLGAWFGEGVRGTRQARLHRQGLCPSCGYDVRGIVWSERCPECGALLE